MLEAAEQSGTQGAHTHPACTHTHRYLKPYVCATPCVYADTRTCTCGQTQNVCAGVTRLRRMGGGWAASLLKDTLHPLADHVHRGKGGQSF